MSDTLAAALSALGTGVLSLLWVYLAHRKSTALIAWRLEMLERKVDLHNGLIDRMYRAESRLDVMGQTLEDMKGGTGR